MDETKSTEKAAGAPVEARVVSAAAGERLARILALALRICPAEHAAVVGFDDERCFVAARTDGAAAWPGAALLAGLSRALRDIAMRDDGGRPTLLVPLLAEGCPEGVLLLSGAAQPSAAQRLMLAELAGIGAAELARLWDDAERDSLVAELDHRVKNVLAVVQSLAAQSARKTASLDAFLKTFAGRLKSMASAHQLLVATRWRGASMRNIAAAELGGLAPGQTHWQGPDLVLTPRSANAMSLALHELATNAVKFGALSTELGHVEAAWAATPEGGLSLTWTESGGPPVAAPVRHGFGATLLERVTGRELGGAVRIEYRHEGVRAVLTAGASAIAAEPAPAAAPQSPSAPPAVAARPPAGSIAGLRVLIVEDALLLALELEAGLSDAGAKVAGSAADVDEGLRMAALPLDAAVLDANLNGESVMPVAEALAARGVPFIFATGYGDAKFTPSGFDVPLIKKPYDVTQIAAALAEVTGRRAA